MTSKNAQHLQNGRFSSFCNLGILRFKVEVMFGAKSTSKTHRTTFTPSPKVVDRKQNNYR